MSLNIDIIFKAFFKSEENRPLLIALLNDFLPLPSGTEIVAAHILDPELLAKDASRKRGVLDIKAEVVQHLPQGVPRHKIVGIEMQTTSHPFLPERLTFYACKLYGEQLLVGQNYGKLKNVYSLTFTTFHIPHLRALADYCHAFDIRGIRPPHIPFTPALCFVIVELSKFQHSLGQLLDSRTDWCYLLKNSGQMTERDAKALSLRGKIMSKAVRSLWNLSQDEAMRRIELAEEIHRCDLRTQKEYIKQKAKEKGKQEGRQEGLQEGRLETARKFLEAGTDPKFVAKVTGLSLEEIKKLQSKS